MRALGQARAQEARAAAAVLGVPADHTFMLGYPDGGLFSLFTTAYDERYVSPHSGAGAVCVNGALERLSVALPGKSAQSTPLPPAPTCISLAPLGCKRFISFTSNAREADLNRVLDSVQPDLVLAPAPQDVHPDHLTLSSLAVRLLSARQQAGELRFWVVHGGLEWPLPKGLHPSLSLTLPPLTATLFWTRVDLTAQQVGRKVRAIDVYRSQTRVMSRFLHSFVRANELLSLEAQPTATAPHPAFYRPLTSH